MQRRVVITGMGVVTTLGLDVGEFWDAIKNGRNGICEVTRFDTTGFDCRVAAEIKDFDPTVYIDKKEAKRMDRFTQYAMTAAKKAMTSSGIDLEKIDHERMGSIIGSGIGGVETLENQCQVMLQRGPSRVSALFIPMMIANIASGQIAMEFNAKGFNECVVTACSTSANAIGDAYKVIQRGDADIMISGGSEAPLTPLSMAGFSSMKAITSNPDPNTASRPFDLERDGFIMAEGAAVVILEEYEFAVKRGAGIIAEVIGYGCTNDAYHLTAPSPGGEGAARCMAMALRDAGITPEMIGYVNAHGTSTLYNDKFETMAIRTVFGKYADKLPVSSTKSMTGHLLGAAGAIETIITSLALKEGFLPPTINYKTPDPECDLDYVPNQGRVKPIAFALTNSFGFGGCNATIVLKRYDGE